MAPTSRRARTTERYYRIRWLGFPPAEDTWESRERLMEDIPDVVKEYEATLALVFDDSGSEGDHGLVSAIANEYWRGETPGNDDIIATSISDEAPATRTVAARSAATTAMTTTPPGVLTWTFQQPRRPLRDPPLVAPCSLRPARASRVREGIDAP
ncbi:unnamed protein product [Phytophthora fragariaefolia]|uniref:Unnamed protein product n=1 Tax=Phytophthora fragariaefolia TaxID=1490495 RepID=A0A9W6YPJ2_9STRA|nr:unnamed protein product [Phytophthora fragariaefolia]